MQLSEAIRDGAKYGPQLFGELWDDNGGSCAVGAAMLACWRGRVPLATVFYDRSIIGASFPILTRTIDKLPCSCEGDGLISIGRAVHDGDVQDWLWNKIVHLNNYHRWSREAIAEWVETLEAACPTSAAAVTPTESSKTATPSDEKPSVPVAEPRSSCARGAGTRMSPVLSGA